MSLADDIIAKLNEDEDNLRRQKLILEIVCAVLHNQHRPTIYSKVLAAQKQLIIEANAEMLSLDRDLRRVQSAVTETRP